MEAKDYVLALKGFGLTQTQIEKMTGIPQSNISKIETGAVSDVMSKTYRALQVAYISYAGASVPATSERQAANA